MNRLVLIGNGFDLAHRLPTSYQDFINWYWNFRFHGLIDSQSNVSEDVLCKMTCIDKIWTGALYFDYELKNSYGIDIYNHLKSNNNKYKIELSPLFERIMTSVETKGWVDIEIDYYELLKKYVIEGKDVSDIEKLNNQLQYLQDKLVKYLKGIEISDKLLKTDIRQKIYDRFKSTDISISGKQALKEHINERLALDDRDLEWKLSPYGGSYYIKGNVEDYRNRLKNEESYIKQEEPPLELMMPNHIMLLNFNYTHTADLYCKDASIFTVNQIHGDLNNPKSVIFGYGDELDKDYKTILEKNENKYLGNIKSIKYLEADNYRRMLSFIESEPYQILIMGHSCGNSDRTLLNTLFEHKNCVSIKPYYYKWGEGEKDDNYIELVQNISRNFTDMKLMRDRVVNKTYCEPLTNI